MEVRGRTFVKIIYLGVMDLIIFENFLWGCQREGKRVLLGID